MVALSQRSVPRRLGGPTSAIEMTPLGVGDGDYVLDKALTLLRNEQICTPSFFPLQLLLKLTDGTGCLLLLFDYVLHYRWNMPFRPMFFVLLPGVSPNRNCGSDETIETHAKGVRIVLLGGPVRSTEHRRHKELLLTTGFMLEEVNRPPPAEQTYHFPIFTHRAYRVTLEKRGHIHIIPPKLKCEWINPSDEVSIWLSLARSQFNVCSEPPSPVRQTQSVMATDRVSPSETRIQSKNVRLLPRGWFQSAHPFDWWLWWVRNANLRTDAAMPW